MLSKENAGEDGDGRELPKGERQKRDVSTAQLLKEACPQGTPWGYESWGRRGSAVEQIKAIEAVKSEI